MMFGENSQISTDLIFLPLEAYRDVNFYDDVQYFRPHLGDVATIQH